MKLVHDMLMAGIPELDENGFRPRGRMGGMCFYGKGGGSSAPSPDPNIGLAALKNAQLGDSWLAFAKEQFAVGNERQEATDALNTRVIEQQLATQDQTNKWAQEDRARYKSVFQPLEDQFIKTANEYASPEKQEEAAAEARSAIIQNSELQRQATERNMASMGVSPDSGRFAGVTRAQEMNTALASAGAQNNARQVIRDKGIALRADAINLGKGLPASAASAYGIGLNAGNSAVANNASGNANFYANQGIMTSGFGGAMNAYNSSGSLLNNLYGNQLQGWAAQQQANATSAGGLGSFLGTIGGAAISKWSDQRLKTNIKKIGALDNGVNLYSYEFKDEFKDEMGYGQQIGVMAQEVEHIPGAVSFADNGYRKVDYVKVVNHGI